MSDPSQKATLLLRVIGPLQDDDALPVGASAWITVGEDEPLIVPLPIGPRRDPIAVEVAPGRVIIQLRTPAGKRGRRELLLQPGEEKSLEFGKAKVVVVDSTGNTTEPAFFTAGPDAPWLASVRKIHVLKKESPNATTIAKYVAQQDDVSLQIEFIEASKAHIEVQVRQSVAFIVIPDAPHRDRALFHRAAWTRDLVRFIVKPRYAPAAIPIDTEVILEDVQVMSLLSFVSNGDLSSARAESARFAEVADHYLGGKFANPDVAAVGAYALHLLREADRYAHWIRNLYVHFEDLSDGAILYATHLMRSRPGAISEWYAAARQALITATTRPVPLLTIGVHLLVDGLERLSSSKRAAGDTALAKALERARWIQARLRPDEVFTALWMDRRDLPEAFLPYKFEEP